MKLYEAFNETETLKVQFTSEDIAKKFATANNMQFRQIDVVSPPKLAKTAKEYIDYANQFYLEFSQDCIDEGNDIPTNDAIGLHFVEIFDELKKARLDKVYFLLKNSTILLPFYTQEVKDRYVAKLESFFKS